MELLKNKYVTLELIGIILILINNKWILINGYNCMINCYYIEITER